MFGLVVVRRIALKVGVIKVRSIPGNIVRDIERIGWPPRAAGVPLVDGFFERFDVEAGSGSPGRFRASLSAFPSVENIVGQVYGREKC